MKKLKKIFKVLLFLPALFVFFLSFTNCTTTDNSKNESTTPPALEEEKDTVEDLNNANPDSNYNDSENYDGIQPKRGTLIDKPDTIKNNK